MGYVNSREGNSPPKKKTPASIICSLRSSISEPLITGCFLRPGSISNLREVGWPNLRFVGPKKTAHFLLLKVENWWHTNQKKNRWDFFWGGEVGGVSWRGSKHKKSFCVCFSKKSRVEKRDVNLISSHPPAVDDPEVFYLQDTSSRLFLFVFASSDFLFLSFLKFFSFKNSWESSRCVNDEMHTFLILYVAQFGQVLIPSSLD